MPQIWPMNWMFLLFLMITLLLMFSTLNYFLISPSMKTSQSFNHSCKSMTWLW